MTVEAHRAPMGAAATANPDAAAASFVSVGALLAKQARIRGSQAALRTGSATLTYRELDQRVNRVGRYLQSRGVGRGDRVAILSENSGFYVEVALAAARLGAILATVNWRLAEPELVYCIELAAPKVLLVSPRWHDRHARVRGLGMSVLIDAALEAEIAALPRNPVHGDCAPEDGCVIIYTSGTTGFPKAAVISQRALLARVHTHCIEYGINHEDTFLCWSPLFHTAAAELAIGSLLIGGQVVVSDGLDFDQMCTLLETEPLSNLIFFPGMAEDLIAKLEKRRPKVLRLKKFGALADLFAPSQIARLTRLLGTPYTNTFGMTEAGMAPASGGRIPIGTSPDRLPKMESTLCDVRLVDSGGGEVPAGTVGELLMRGPTLFSGYLNDPEATAAAFRGGWYHSGDMFVRNEDGTLTNSGRAKYLIKSGGENIYPAEIERVILGEPGIEDVVVVARRDETWGEVPVAVIAAPGARLDLDAVRRRCAEGLARYKQPKAIYVVEPAFLPRNNTGKVIRKEIESWVAAQPHSATGA